MKIHSHYDNLKVSRDAPQEVIRAAYRTLCQKYHPDRRLDDPDAERVMKIINASYAVLSDPAQRKEHDDWLARKEREAGASKASSARASSSSSGASQSSFHAAAAAAAAQQSASGSPGRTPPPRSSQRASGWSSTARVDPRAAQGKREPARSSSGFSLRKISLRSWIAIGVCGFFGYVAITESTSPFPFTRNTASYDSAYGPRSRTDSAPAADAADKRRSLTALSTAKAATSPWAHDVSATNATDATTGEAGNAAGDKQHELFVRPTVAPNGSPWPAKASYLEGMPVGASDGHSSVTIDNSSNPFDVFGKLVYNASVFDQPVRHFFIPAGQTFTLTDVAPGNYDVRYQNLADGGMFKSQNFGLFEQDGGIGAKASNVSIMLYGSPGSNVQATSIGRGEF